MQLKDAPDTVDSNKNQFAVVIIIVFQKVNQDCQTTSTDKHLENQSRGLVHLSHKGCSFETTNTLPSSRLPAS